MTNWSLSSGNGTLPRHRRLSDKVALFAALVAMFFVGAIVLMH